MGKRLAAIFAAVAMILTVSLTSAPPASAWTGNLQTCAAAGYETTLPQGFFQKIDQTFNANNDYTTADATKAVYSDFNGVFGVWILFGSSTAQFDHNVSTGENSLKVGGHPNNPSGVDYFRSGFFVPVYSGDEFTSVSQNVGLATDGDLFNVSANTTCIENTMGATYTSSWADGQFPGTATTVDGEGEACDALDFGCWLSPIFDGIADTFIAVGQAIVKGITTIFVPDSEIMTQLFTDFGTFFNDKFGFLFYPIQFLIDLLNGIVNTSDSGIGFCSLPTLPRIDGGAVGSGMATGTLFGDDFFSHWQVCSIRESTPLLWNVVTTVIKGLTVFALVMGIYKKYKGIIHK